VIAGRLRITVLEKQNQREISAEVYENLTEDQCNYYFLN
jgi:hypothetical protein